MLKLIRAGLVLLTSALLVVGYALSQVSYPEGAQAYARRVDQPPVWRASLVLFLALVVLACLPNREEP